MTAGQEGASSGLDPLRVEAARVAMEILTSGAPAVDVDGAGSLLALADWLLAGGSGVALDEDARARGDVPRQVPKAAPPAEVKAFAATLAEREAQRVRAEVPA